MFGWMLPLQVTFKVRNVLYDLLNKNAFSTALTGVGCNAKSRGDRNIFWRTVFVMPCDASTTIAPNLFFSGHVRKSWSLLLGKVFSTVLLIIERFYDSFI